MTEQNKDKEAEAKANEEVMVKCRQLNADGNTAAAVAVYRQHFGGTRPEALAALGLK